jgi:hypothetical protein
VLDLATMDLKVDCLCPKPIALCSMRYIC